MKQELYRTAVAKISCAHFKAGDHVTVKYICTSNGGIDWYEIDGTQNGKLPCIVCYPAHHLYNFVL